MIRTQRSPTKLRWWTLEVDCWTLRLVFGQQKIQVGDKYFPFANFFFPSSKFNSFYLIFLKFFNGIFFKHFECMMLMTMPWLRNSTAPRSLPGKLEPPAQHQQRRDQLNLPFQVSQSVNDVLQNHLMTMRIYDHIKCVKYYAAEANVITRMMVDFEVIDNAFRNGVEIQESNHYSRYTNARSANWVTEQGSRTLVSYDDEYIWIWFSIENFNPNLFICFLNHVHH